MGIDAAGMGTVLSILSNMYSDGSLAVVREYSSNALDSHVEAGNPDPILITSPSQFSPTFVVQDFGTGLSETEVLNVYAQYGSSTKRDSNDQIGAFGIGAKSAFTVGTQFVVTAVKDGMQTIALFALNENGAPTVNILSSTATLEPNGVKVEVGVRDVSGVNRAIERLFPTWKPGTVLVDGVEPPSVWNNLEEVHPGISIGWREERNNSSNAITLVMGGIPYVVPSSVVDSLSGRARQVVYGIQQSWLNVYMVVPIGSVDITPSREELRVTSRTTATIDKLVEHFNTGLIPWISRQIEQAPTLVAALIMKHQLMSKLNSVGRDVWTGMTWHGQILPTKNVELKETFWFSLKSRGYYGEKTAAKNTGYVMSPGQEHNHTLFVIDVPERRVRSVQLAAKPYLMDQVSANGHTRVVALTLPVASYTQSWFDLSDSAFATVDFASFIDEWKPKAKPSTRTETKYEVIGNDGDPMVASELLTEAKVYYLRHSQRGYGTSSNALRIFTAEDELIVLLSATQKEEVFTRKVPHAINLYTAMQEAAGKLVSKLCPTDNEILFSDTFYRAANPDHMNFFRKNAIHITNPVVLSVLTHYQIAMANRQRQQQRMNLLRTAAQFIGYSLNTDGREYIEDDRMLALQRVADGLPLLYAYLKSRYDITDLGNEHVIQYINSIDLKGSHR